MRDNDKTLRAYEEEPQGYVDKTPPEVVGDLKQWIDLTLSMVGPDARVLELGSGFGRDANYIESQGFKVQRTEAAVSFVKMMQHRGDDAILLNAITGDYGGPYDLIFADAVLLHFSPGETETVLKKTHDALALGGLFSFRLKAGIGAEWDSAMKQPRFLQYWLPDELKKVLVANGFVIVWLDEGHSKFNKFTWLQAIARKK